MSYCVSRFQSIRRRTIEVNAGGVGIGGGNPVRVQSMTTTDTQDIAATVRQCIALAEVGCEIIRITAPNTPAARCLRDIRREFDAAGFARIPLVADIHFLPAAAMEAVEHVEKVRVNPGNYADKKKFAHKDYTDADYDLELQRLHEAFTPLVLRAKALGRSLRIGTNHGSLSDRIMNRYGDTPLGMVESALEFLRIAESHSFRQIVLSMKSSNPKVMIQAYRLLVARMQEEDMHYPLHLGVTEAGDGEDGRIKGAIGIGSLLADGLGDTLRVSLTEDSIYEIPVAQALAAKAHALWRRDEMTADKYQVSSNKYQVTDGGTNAPPVNPIGADGSGGTGVPPVDGAPRRPSSDDQDHIDPFHYTRRDIAPLTLASAAEISIAQPPRVIVRAPAAAALPETLEKLSSPLLADTPAEAVIVPLAGRGDAGLLAARIVSVNKIQSPPAFILDLSPTLAAGALHSALGLLPPDAPILLLRTFTAADATALRDFAALAQSRRFPLVIATTARDLGALAPALLALPDAAALIFTLADTAAESRATHPVGGYRQLAESLRGLAPHTASRAPLWIRNTPSSALASASTPHGGHVASLGTEIRNPHSSDFLSRLLDASILTGSLLCDGLGDLVSVETDADPVRATRLAYNILQGAGSRISKTEFVACPSCGRTLFDLQTTTQRIRAQTGHLKGVKLAIMGCIVNGPGEMADADFGYVGGAPGKINLYVGKTCVQYNIPQAEADARLIALIKQHGKWLDPAP
ncbi:(E)-4-hydroxy-3-methylbut-2-enyl-diphosphate synthase [Termitidicoccus mucosus]|uniref:4-hydroxy-3-methylbut-2-en-1-yl diphosphate synthase (flavodoxin) n=1 Tax=Termitidicoccus mucosus TaxID=1184151 RepID=A0A178ILP9_9BACT|nr:1-hydroxy-2-methyl-2-(E)-butenyl 4-diphosphate synthase [Opitutaceae bacterium TSB47]